MKKAIQQFTAILLTILLSAGALCFLASAQGTPMQVQVVSTAGSPGESVQVKVDITNNPGISSLKFKVLFDDMLTLTAVSFNSAFGSYVTAPEPFKNPQTISLISPLTEIKCDGTLATLTFAISKNAPSNYSADVRITYDPDDVFDGQYNNVSVEMLPGSVHIAGRIAGDADENGVVNLRDVVLIRRWMVGGWNAVINTSNADVSGDGEVELNDVVLIRRYLAGGWNAKLV